MDTKFGVSSVLWKFLACPAPGGGRPMEQFVSGLGEESLNNFSARLEGLQVLERHQWKRPQFDVLEGERYKGMGEIIFSGDKKTYRVFGYFGPERKNFTFLIGCLKKRNLKTEMDQAATRKKFAEANPHLLYAFTFET